MQCYDQPVVSSYYIWIIKPYVWSIPDKMYAHIIFSPFFALLFLAVGRVSEDNHRINFTELLLFFQFESFFLDFSFLFQ